MDSVALQCDSQGAYLKKLYLFEEGLAVFSFAFLFEGLPGIDAALLGVASGADGAPSASPLERTKKLL